MNRLFLTSVKLEHLVNMVDDPNKTNIAFIPTAADPYDDKWFIEADRKKLKELGFSVIEVDLKNKTKEELFNILKDMDVVYVAGGNSFYLLEKVKESGFDDVIKRLLDKGVVYAGSSAGAVIACQTIEPIKLLDDPSKAPNLKSYQGLGLVDFIVLPHYGKEKYQEKFSKIISDYGEKNFKFVPITDEQSIVVENNNYKIIE